VKTRTRILTAGRLNNNNCTIFSFYDHRFSLEAISK
jgi:hypothetical protein